MIAVRYVGTRFEGGYPRLTYQGRITLPSAEVEDSTGRRITALRPVGYAEVEVREKTHPDVVRRLLADEFAAGRWWVFVGREIPATTLPPVRHTVGRPADVEDRPAAVTLEVLKSMTFDLNQF